MSGKNPLGLSKEPQAYEGVNVIVPVGGWRLVRSVRNPTTNDFKYPIGSIWINTSNNTAWLLTSNPGNWSEFAASVAGAVTSLTGDSGGAIQPAAGNITLAGTANQITTSGAGSTITFSLVGPYTPATFTNHGVLVGAGTSSIAALAAASTGTIMVGVTGANPKFLTAGTTGQLLSAATGADPAYLTAGTNGQLLVGSTGAQPAFATTTTSTGIAFTTGAGTLAIDIKTGGFAVVDQNSSSVNMAVQTMYVIDNGSTQVVLTLPATAPQGSVMKIVGSSAGGWKIAQNANQQIVQNQNASTSGVNGSVSSTSKNNCVELIASVGGASTVWTVASSSDGPLTFV